MENVLKLERDSQQKVLQLERRVQKKTFEFFEDLFHPGKRTQEMTLEEAKKEAVLATIPPQAETPIILTPIDVSGYYKVTGPQEVTFYAVTEYPSGSLTQGWSAVGITGIIGQIQVTSFSKNPGVIQLGQLNTVSYLWSFTIQSDTDQSVEGVQYATGAILYPPGQFKFKAQKASAPLYGRYEVISGIVNFQFTVPPPLRTGPGWIVENLPGIKSPLRVVMFEPRIATYSNLYTGQTMNQATYVAGNDVYESLAILEIIDGSPAPLIDVPVYVQGSPAVIHEAYYSTVFVPGNFTERTFDLNARIILNQNIKTGNSSHLRDLNYGIPWDPPPVQLYIDEKDRGLSQGSVLALNAIGPQENYLLSNNYEKSQFSSLFNQYTNFVMFQRVTPFPPPNPSYQGNTVQIELRPTELGHLLSNMYLHVKMPAIKGYTYSEHIGRALIKQIDLLVNETVIETLYDDWYIIRDQLFLDADEVTGVYAAVNVQPKVSAPVIGTGGTLAINAAANTVHTFTSNGTFTINTASTVNLLVVGGGGAGSNGLYQTTNSANVYYSPGSPNSLTVPLSSMAGAAVYSNTLITSIVGNFPSVSNITSVSSTGVTLQLVGSTTWASYATGASIITVGSNVFTGTTVTLTGINPTTTNPITVSPASSSALVGLPATFVSQNVQFSGTVSAANSSTLTINPITGIQWIILPSGVNLTIYNGNGGGGGGIFNKSVFLLPGTYPVTIGAGGTQASPNGGSSSLGKYLATGGYGGAYGGASGTSYTSNSQFLYLSNTYFESGGGAGGGANVTTGTGASAFTTAGTLGRGGIGASYSNGVTFSTEYYGGGGGGAANTSITRTLVTPGGSGGGGAGSSNTFITTATVSALSNTLGLTITNGPIASGTKITGNTAATGSFSALTLIDSAASGSNIVTVNVTNFLGSGIPLGACNVVIGSSNYGGNVITSSTSNIIFSSAFSQQIYANTAIVFNGTQYANVLVADPISVSTPNVQFGTDSSVNLPSTGIPRLTSVTFSQNTAAISGTVNTGGGGGGAFGSTPGNGGSGVVVLWYSATANTIPSSEIVTPLEFFFCRRHSANNKARERLRRPYFPLCAMWNQRMYVRFTFQPNVWWCNAPVGSMIDIYDPSTTILPTLITEEILLNNDERLYYMNTPLKYLVPRVQRESTLAFSGNNPSLELTANFPVQTIAWFFRNKNYESLSDGRYSDSRYSYGYTTQYIATGIQLQFPSGNSNFVDVISTAKITLNNVDILSTFQGSLYYSFKQPIEHGLTIPSKNIYTYSFGLSPKEYNQGGYLNFSKLNSQTTNLQLVFNPQYTAQITQGYNLYLFYYGYTLLVFQGGFATTPFQ